MALLLSLLVCLILVGCSRELPKQADFWSIVESRYGPDNTCLEKANNYRDLLRTSGYDAEVLTCFYKIQPKHIHAIVRVKYKDKQVYADTTTGDIRYNLDNYVIVYNEKSKQIKP